MHGDPGSTYRQTNRQADEDRLLKSICTGGRGTVKLQGYGGTCRNPSTDDRTTLIAKPLVPILLAVIVATPEKGF